MYYWVCFCNCFSFYEETILLIVTVAALILFPSMYLGLGGILSKSHLISFTTLINSSFSSLQLSIWAFLTNVPSHENELMWFVSFFCSLLCPCSTKTFRAPCPFEWLCLILLCSIISWLSSWTCSVLSFLSHYLIISSIFVFNILLFYPIFSSSVVYIFSLWAHSLSSTNSQSCLLPFPIYSLFCLILCLMTTCSGQIRYPMYAGRVAFTTSGSSSVHTVIFNSLIWHFTLFETVF